MFDQKKEIYKTQEKNINEKRMIETYTPIQKLV